ncbi:MAG: hypothetical protein IPH49_15875 [Ignavibacteria bacterium]|nr:hypothetical protein [Ignavibacteria bacterium]
MSTDINWHPLTPDVVFEDGKEYLLSTIDNSIYYGEWSANATKFYLNTDGQLYRKELTHYARVNEP